VLVQSHRAGNQPAIQRVDCWDGASGFYQVARPTTWTFTRMQRMLHRSSAGDPGRRWLRDRSRSRLQAREHNMWTILFNGSLAAEVCLGVMDSQARRSVFTALE
jgi:hypothetical protein